MLDRRALCSALAVTATCPAGVHHVIALPAELRSRGVELKFVLADGSDPRPPALDQVLISTIARAHDWSERLLAGESIGAIASSAKVTPRYVHRLLDLAFLAPDIIEAILDGRQPADLTAERLTRQPIPLAWSEQQAIFGFR